MCQPLLCSLDPIPMVWEDCSTAYPSHLCQSLAIHWRFPPTFIHIISPSIKKKSNFYRPYFFLTWWLRRWGVCLQCGRPGFDPWVGKIPRRRKRQPTPVFLPGESHGLRSLVGCSPWGHKESDMTEWLYLLTCSNHCTYFYCYVVCDFLNLLHSLWYMFHYMWKYTYVITCMYVEHGPYSSCFHTSL